MCRLMEEFGRQIEALTKEKAMAEGLAEGRAQGRAEGRAQGMAQGMAQGQWGMLMNLVVKQKLSLSEAAVEMNVTPEEFSEAMRKAGYPVA